jgi:hypothetical protein
MSKLNFKTCSSCLYNIVESGACMLKLSASLQCRATATYHCYWTASPEKYEGKDDMKWPTDTSTER